MHGIYQILNKKNGDCYIGSAVNLQKRTNQHLSMLRRDISKHTHLQRAWNKYGEENFEINILERVADRNDLTQREQFFIDTFKPAYNVRTVAESNLGIQESEETKALKSKVAKARGQNEQQLAALRKAQKNRIGKPVKGKVKESLKLGPLSMVGKPKSKETKEKIRQTKLGEKNYMFGISQEDHPSSKKVKNIMTGEVYASAKQCAEVLGKSYVHVNMILRGRRKNTLNIEYLKE
jgi:group I intron endonuclease